MSFLQVSGAQIYYETRGSGPLLLLIPGASGDANVFSGLAQELSIRCTVATYDRRGFTRSSLNGRQDYAHRLDTDADDALALIRHLTDQPALVFGTSSGAVVALHLLIRHPDAVRKLVSFEPAAMRLLPDGQVWIDFFHEVYQVYRRFGTHPALALFRERTFASVDHDLMRKATHSSTLLHVPGNLMYWFERELREYTSASLNINALKEMSSRIVPAVGRASEGYPTYAAAIELGRLLQREILSLPGGHVGYAVHASEFATELLQAYELT
ncbi:MAG TPA: alpha/beta hydrolase [Gammaproteobacteria bacterium]|nr:alpha/beta hydrolase [Gammaproteobacteria bacterium]